MAKKDKTAKRKFRVPRWLVRWGIAVFVLAGFVWLAVWLTERTYKSHNKRRNLQSWLEDTLNADVSLLGDMIVRLNLVRRSRLELSDVEIDHSNPTFPGKLATIGRIGAWVEPWSTFHLWNDTLDIAGRDIHILTEENESGEWNTDGFMNALVTADSSFPFPIPRFKRWRARLDNSQVTVRRRGHELTVRTDADISGNMDSRRNALRSSLVHFAYGAIDSAERKLATAGPASLSLRVERQPGRSPALVPIQFDARFDNLPVSILPFFLNGVPMESTPGIFRGLCAFRETAPNSGSYQASMDGQLQGIPLGIFGLPMESPIRASWIVGKEAANNDIAVHIGPSGFGGFELRVPRDTLGNPRLLSLQGDVAALDELPTFIITQTRWLDWLSRSFPAIEWRSGSWLGFGWSGSNMQLNLTRTAAGLNLAGEAEMMNGRIRIAMTPEQKNAPVTVTAEGLDPQLLAVKLSQMLPEAFRIGAVGENANLTWKVLPSRTGDPEDDSWSLAIVLSKPVFGTAEAGQWWLELVGIANRVAEALPEWGGGDAAALNELAAKSDIALDQLSIVAEKNKSGGIRVEFVTFGGGFGEAGGWFERRTGRDAAGEIYFTGNSILVDTAEKANPALGQTLRLLANRSLGLRVSFKMAQDGAVTLSTPFLDDAAKLRSEIRQLKNGNAGGNGEP